MKFVSYTYQNRPHYGLVTAQGIVDLMGPLGDTYPDLKSLLASGKSLTLARPYLSAPIDFNASDIVYQPVIPNPNKIVCVGMNYIEKRQAFAQTESAPTLFVRFADSQIGHLGNVIKPPQSNELDYEGELAIIIGQGGRHIAQDSALAHIAGYSCYMDGSLRDWQHSWFTAGKNWPATGAFGPNLTTADEIGDPAQLTIRTLLNDKQVQHDSISHLVHPIPELIAYISTFTCLSAGDVILTGSPGGVGKTQTPPCFMQAGDKIEVEIGPIGRLTNFIVNSVA